MKLWNWNDRLQNTGTALFKAAGWAALGFSLTILMASAGGADAGDKVYRLGPLDRLRIKTYEWRPSRDEVFEWKALNDEFGVGPEGVLSLPLIGEVPAAGQSTEELSRRIAETFRDRMGFAKAPSVSVEVVKFRPFYITGAVHAAGEYPFRPGLTVLQALSVAGGLYRDPAGTRRDREAITTRGELNLINTDLIALVARRARLEAELKSEPEIKFPAELAQRKSMGSIALLFEQEELIFRTRRGSFETEIKALEELRNFLAKQVQSVEAQLVTQERQIALTKKEYEGIQALMKKGLSVASRELGIERNIAQLEGERLKVASQISQIRQELSKTQLSIIGLRNKSANDVTTELRQTQGKIDELAQKNDMNERLLLESGLARANLRLQDPEAQPRFSIVRRSADSSREISASDSTAVEPGDTVKVALPVLAIQNSGDITGLAVNPLPRRLVEPAAGLSKAVQSLIGQLPSATD